MAYVKCDDEIHSRLKVFAAEQDSTMQDLVEGWIREGMSGGDAPASELDGLSKEDRALVRLLIQFLRDEPPGEKKRRRIIEGVLQVFRG
jgi:hypothetical protein